MAKYLLILLLIVSSCEVFAQKKDQQLTDSLVGELGKLRKDDSNRVKLIWVIYDNIKNNIPLKAKYAHEEYEISKKINFQDGIAWYFRYCGVKENKNHNYQKAYLNFDKCLRIVTATKNTKLECITLMNIGSNYGSMGDTLNFLAYRHKWLDRCAQSRPKIELADAYYTYGCDYIESGNYQKCIEYWEASQKIRDEIKCYSNLNILGNIAMAYTFLKDYDHALTTYKRALRQSIIINDSNFIGQFWYNIGKTYLFSDPKNKLVQLDAYNQAYSIFSKIKNGYWMAITDDGIAGVYISTSSYEPALKHLQRGLTTAEKLNDSTIYPVLLADITIVFDKMGYYEKGLQYLLKAKARFVTGSNKIPFETLYLNIGILYYRLKNYDSALAYTLFVAQYDSVNKLADIGGDAMDQLAGIYCKKFNYDIAIQYHNRAIAFYKENRNLPGISRGFSNFGITLMSVVQEDSNRISKIARKYSRKQLLIKAITYMDSSVSIASEQNLTDYLLDDYKNLSTSYELLGDFKAALKYHKLQTTMQDSLFGVEKVQAVTKQDIQYDFDKKEANLKASNEQKLALSRLKRKEDLRTGIIAGCLVLALILSGFWFYRRREKDKVLLQVNALRQEALNAQMSDHFIGNSMNSINQFIQQNDKQKAGEYLIRFSRLIRHVLENAAEKLIPLNDDLDVLKDYLELEKLRFAEGFLQYEIVIGEGIDASRMLIPPMVFQTLAENAIKHGFRNQPNGKLLFSIKRLGGEIECTVEDNGRGRKASETFSDATVKRTPLGTTIAERLIKTVSKIGKDTTFIIMDLIDASNKPLGTKVQFTLPYITEI